MASIVSHTATDTNRKRERECSRGITVRGQLSLFGGRVARM